MLWGAILIVAVAAGFWLVRPFLNSTTVELNESEATVSIFRDQVEELERDRELGLINDAQLAAARAEIEKRALTAARKLGDGLSVSRRAPVAAGSLFLACALGAVATYLWFGSPSKTDQPLAQRRLEVLNKRAAAGDLKSRIEVLIEKTRENPQSFEDWWMLARSYSATGDHASATDAFRKAAELSGDRPTVLSAYAESMTLANANKVPTAARLIFQQIIQKSPDPRARYYLALAKAQSKNFEGALEDWTALARSSQPDAPWMQLVRRDIVNMARFLKRDVTAYLPDATADEIAKAGGGQIDRANLETRAAVLEKRLAAEPKDHKGWIALARVRVSLSQTNAAEEALSQARGHFAAAPFVRAKIDDAARDLGLDIVGSSPPIKGPSAADVAAANKMSPHDRKQIVEGMVAGLAAKLEEKPDNLEGWVMLVRSYAVIGKPDQARAAYQKAAKQFSGNAEAIARLKSNAEKLLGDK